MHICEILSTPIPPEEGIGNYVLGLSKSLLENGHEVTLITRRTRSSHPGGLLNGIHVVRPSFYPLYPLHVSIHGHFVAKWLKSLPSPPDLVHFHSPLVPPIRVSHLSVATVHTPLRVDSRYLEIHDLWALATKLHMPIGYLLETRLFRTVDLVTAVSQHVAKELSVYGIDEKVVDVLGSGVDSQLFNPGKNEVTEGSILYVGRLTARKGLLSLIDAGKLLKEQGIRMKLWFVGKGPLEGYLRKRTARAGLDTKEAVFFGFVPLETLIKIYQRSNIVVVPSRYEGLPSTLLEAMSCGKPIVACRAPGISEVVTHRVHGWLAEADSGRSLAEGIRALLEDTDMQRSLSRNARARVLQSYTWDSVADRFIDAVNLVGGW